MLPIWWLIIDLAARSLLPYNPVGKKVYKILIRLLVDYTRSPDKLLELYQESTWSQSGVHQESIRSPYTLSGVYQESIRSLSGVSGLLMDSIRKRGGVSVTVKEPHDSVKFIYNVTCLYSIIMAWAQAPTARTEKAHKNTTAGKKKNR